MRGLATLGHTASILAVGIPWTYIGAALGRRFESRSIAVTRVVAICNSASILADSISNGQLELIQ
jgi:hypothetical protein